MPPIPDAQVCAGMASLELQASMGIWAQLCSQHTLTSPWGNGNTAEPGEEDFWHLELGKVKGTTTGQSENIKTVLNCLAEQEQDKQRVTVCTEKGRSELIEWEKRHLSKSTINSIDRLWIDWWVNKENHSERKVLPLPSIDSFPPLQKEERAAASGQRGAGISVAGCGAYTRTTTKGQCDGEDDISFHHQTYINTIQPAK